LVEPKHNHRRYIACPKDCPRLGMSDGPCAICGKDSKMEFLVGTGGGHDYPACSREHHEGVWLALDCAQVAGENKGLPPAPWPIAYPPDWIEEFTDDDGVTKGTLEDLRSWAALPTMKAALDALRS
jgi:hypothetical protein